MKNFRLFGEDSREWGSWDDNYIFENPNDRGGAATYFDAWEECGSLQFRIWHIKKDLHIDLIGNGFNIVERKIKFHPDEFQGMDYSSYCTTIIFQLTEPQGQVEVKIPDETFYDDDAIIQWGNGIIKDFIGREAKLDIKALDHYKISEILTPKQKQNFVLEDRVDKLIKIVQGKSWSGLARDLFLAKARGEFKV